MDAESVWDDGDLADDEGESVSDIEKARREKEEAKWEAMVAKEKVEEVTMVEVPFFTPLGSKSAPEAGPHGEEGPHGLRQGVRQPRLPSSMC